MKLRIRIPGLAGAARETLARRVRLFLGRHSAAVEVVEISRARQRQGVVADSDRELVVKLRDGGEIRVRDDGDLHRALLHVAFRIDQRRERGLLREGAPSGPAGRAH